MTDTVSPAERSRIMARVRSENTKPEIAVRRLLHAKGFRFRLHKKGLPGKPDIVLTRFKIVVFVHGCFWHWHGCSRSRMPSSNVEYWKKKIYRNVERDKRTRAALQEQGWTCWVIWECEVEKGTSRLLRSLVRKRKKDDV